MTTEDLQRTSRRVAEISNLTSAAKVLEIGCGNGLLLAEVSKWAEGNFFGIDVSQNMIKNAEARMLDPDRFQFQKSEAISIPFEPVVFDVVYLHSVVQYFPNTKYLHRLLNVSFERIKPGGCLILLDVPDLSLRSKYLKAREARNETRLNKFGKLKHLFVSRSKLTEEALSLGYVSCQYFIHPTRDYENANYRFNVAFFRAADQNEVTRY